MSKIMHLVYDDYNGNLYGHIDYIGAITAHGCGVPKSCMDCWYNTGQCEDCVFIGSEQCVYPNKDKKIVIKEVDK